MFDDEDQFPDSIAIGEYLIPSDPADLTVCDGCQ